MRDSVIFFKLVPISNKKEANVKPAVLLLKYDPCSNMGTSKPHETSLFLLRWRKGIVKKRDNNK